MALEIKAAAARADAAMAKLLEEESKEQLSRASGPSKKAKKRARKKLQAQDQAKLRAGSPDDSPDAPSVSEDDASTTESAPAGEDDDISAATALADEVAAADFCLDCADTEPEESTAKMLDRALLNEPPDEFTCPITQELMLDPVFCTDGHTYERRAIEQWLGFGKGTSPKTGEALESPLVFPNHVMRRQIIEWREACSGGRAH